MERWAVLLLALSGIAADSVDFYAAPPASDDPGLTFSHLTLTTGRQAKIPAILAKVASPMGWVSVELPSDRGCTKRQRTSETALENGCTYAVNGGPFDMNTGACMGDIVSDSQVYQLNDTTAFNTWGMTEDGRHAVGVIGSETVSGDPMAQLVSGFIAPSLIKDGVPEVSTSTLIAPRTALGIDANGALLLLTVDGIEGGSRGMNMTELAAAFAELGAQQAVNLDGGGSTVAWYDGEVIDHPTCTDSLVKCERAVASIICVKSPEKLAAGTSGLMGPRSRLRK